MRSRPAFPPLAMLCSAALAVVASPSGASAQAQRIEVQPLANETALTPQDVAVLDSLVVSALSELPQGQFEVVADKTPVEATCDTPCRVARARGRGASRTVVGRVAPFGSGLVGALELYDTATGQLIEAVTTDVAADAPALLGELKKAAQQLRRRIAPDAPPPAPALPAPPPAPPMTRPPVGAEAVTATLRVETTPPGASIFITRLGQTNPAGVSPVEKTLLPVEYVVTAKMKDHRNAEAVVRLDPLATRTVRFTLFRVYPMSPYKKLGHAAFWTGILLCGFGFVSAMEARSYALAYDNALDDEVKQKSEIWAGTMWASFGLGAVLTITGIVLWAATPSSKETWEKEHGQLALAQTSDGSLVASYSRRF
jgi:hypothetical protein